MNIDRNRIIQVVGLKRQYKQMNKPYFLRAIYDVKIGGYISGLDVLEDKALNVELKKKFNITEDSMFPVKDGERLDLTKDEHFIKYLYCIITPQIAFNRKAVNTSDHLFYLHDAIAEAEIKIAKHNYIEEAILFIAKLSEKEIFGLAAYLGINIREVSPLIIKANLKQIAIDDPEQVVRYIKTPNPERHVFVSKLFIYDILRTNNDGVYFRDQYVANSKEEALTKIFESTNKPLLQRLNNAMEVIENPVSAKTNVIIKDSIQDVIDEETKKVIEQKDTETAILQAKFDYYKLTGTDYTGEESLNAISLAVTDYNTAKDEVAKFEAKFATSDITALKKSASARGIDEGLWSGVSDVEELKRIIIKHISSK